MSSVPCSSSFRFLYWFFSLIDVDTYSAGCGCLHPHFGGALHRHGLTVIRTTASGNGIRTPMGGQHADTASNDDTHYGYMLVIVNAATLRMEFHPAQDGGTAKTPDDAFTLDLKTSAICA
jgi:hypothetical protein